MAEVESARVDEVAREEQSPAQPSVPARFRAVRLESEGYPKQQAVSCIQSNKENKLNLKIIKNMNKHY